MSIIMSGNIIDLLPNLIESSTSNSVQLHSFLQSCLEHGSFHSQDNAEAVIKIINNNLNSFFEKEKGLNLLQNFLSQISVDTFSSNATSWMVSCNKIISKKEGITTALALKVLSKLIKFSVKFPEVNKDTAKQIVPTFLLDHVRRKSTPQVSVELLECVQSCMREYPGPSGEFRLDIVKLLLSTVESKKEVVEAASRCVPLVAGVGGGGKQGVSHKTAWQRQQMGLVRLLHSLLNRLYEHVDCQMEDDVEAVGEIQLTVELINDRNILTKSQRLATQFTSVALFLQAMLLEEFPVAKAVAPDAILDVIVHAQKPTLATLGSSREALAVTAVLPNVQVAAFKLLESLVLCLGRNLVPQGGLVCYLCSQVIHWTYQQHSDWPYAMDKPFSQTRHAAYCCLYSWLTVAGAASQLETVMDKLIPPMLADIHAEKPSIRLRVGSNVGKKKKKQQILVNQEDRSEKLGDPLANGRLCERALLTLVLLMRTTVTKLKPDTVLSITNTVLRLVADQPVPYSDANCLTVLYELLLTLCLEPHPRVVVPLASAVAALTSGTHHPSPKVRATCIAGLSSLDKVIHPTAATLHFPVTQDKAKLERKIEEEENDDENSMPALKRVRVKSLNDTQLVDLVGPDDSEEQLSTTVLDEKDIEVVDCDESSDSEVVELIPIESQTHSTQIHISEELSNSQSLDINGGEIVKMVCENNDEEIDVVEITEGSENVSSDFDNMKYEEKILGIGFKNESGCNERTNKNYSGLQSREESFIVSSSTGSEMEEQKIEHEKDMISKNDKSAEDNDAEVSQMLMDFTDEVNEGGEN